MSDTPSTTTTVLPPLALTERLHQLAVDADPNLPDDAIETFIHNASIIVNDVQQRTALDMATSAEWLRMGLHSPRIGGAIFPSMYMLYYKEPGEDTITILSTDKTWHRFWQLRSAMAREVARITAASAAPANFAIGSAS